jgi:hypothetical protein
MGFWKRTVGGPFESLSFAPRGRAAVDGRTAGVHPLEAGMAGYGSGVSRIPAFESNTSTAVTAFIK